MELHAVVAVAMKALAGAVVQRDVRGIALRGDAEAVVLHGDEHTARLHVLHRMVRAAMAEVELEGVVPEREPEQLMAEANAEERHGAEQVADRLDLAGEHGRIAGPIRDQHRARLRLEDRVGIPRTGNDERLEAGMREPLRDRALRAEVDDRHARPGADGKRFLRADLAVEWAAVDRRLVERALS